jgi:hypothetical protein
MSPEQEDYLLMTIFDPNLSEEEVLRSVSLTPGGNRFVSDIIDAFSVKHDSSLPIKIAIASQRKKKSQA